MAALSERRALQDMRVLVTGCCGRIGAAACRELLAACRSVRGLDVFAACPDGALAGHAACGDKDFTAYAAGPSKKALASGSDGAAVLDKAAESLSEERVEFIGSSMDMDAFIRRAIMAGDDETPVGVAVFSNKREISPTVRALGAVLGAHAGVKVCQFANPPAEALEAYGIRNARD